MDITKLKSRLARLRAKYAKWKKEHPRQQSEEMINEFLLLKVQLKALDYEVPYVETPLDEDAKTFKVGIIPEVPKDLKFGYPYAPVRGSGQELGPSIGLDDCLPYLKDFVIATPTSWIVGGIIERESTKGDIDLLHMLPDSEELARIIDFRIYRMLPKHLADRIHACWENRGSRSPFTSFLSLYRLKYERIPGAQIEPMAEPASRGSITTSLKPGGIGPPYPSGFAEIKLRAKGVERQEREANRAMKLDKITAGSFFLPQKPCRGYVPGQAQTLEFFLSLWKDEQFPVYSSKKMDGFHAIAWRIGDKITVYTEDGENITDQIPSIVDAIKRLKPKKICLDMEVEAWKNSQHLPREYSASLLRTKEIDDSPLIGCVFDLLYYEEKGDIHKLPFSKRWAILSKINFPQSTEKVPDLNKKLNRIPHHLNENRKELEEETRRLSRLIGGEGNVAKQASAGYDLTGVRPMSWIKFHNSSQFTAIVISAVETKTKGTFNLEWGLLSGDRKVKEDIIRKVNSREVAYGGKTFAVREEEMGKRGEHIVIETETFNVIYDTRTEAYDFSAWSPRFLGKTKEKLDTIKSAEERAIRDRCFQAKLIDQEGKIHYLPGKSREEIPGK